MPGLEVEDDPVRDGLVEMLSASRAKRTAIELLDQVRAEVRDRVLAEARQELAAATRRAAALREERQELGWFARGRRAELDKDVTQQEDAAARWSAEVDGLLAEQQNVVARETFPDPTAPLEVDALRVALTAPDSDMVEALGARPDGFAEREAWLRDATELVTHGAPLPEAAAVLDPSFDGPELSF